MSEHSMGLNPNTHDDQCVFCGAQTRSGTCPGVFSTDPLGLLEPLFPDRPAVQVPPARPPESTDTLVERERWVRRLQEDIADCKSIRLLNLDDAGRVKDAKLETMEIGIMQTLQEILDDMLVPKDGDAEALEEWMTSELAP